MLVKVFVIDLSPTKQAMRLVCNRVIPQIQQNKMCFALKPGSVIYFSGSAQTLVPNTANNFI